MILLIILILSKKTEKQQNIIISIIYSFCIIYFYNLFIALFLSYLNIKNTLLIISIIYILISLIIYYYSKKKYNKFIIQKYYLSKKDLFCFIFIILFCFALGITRYSKSFNIANYEIGDSAVHYKLSLEYSEHERLFFQYHKNETINYNNPIFGFYVPCGIFMKISPFPTIVSYNIFNTMILSLMACCFYATLLIIKEKKGNNLFTLLFVLLYILAYPLNYMLYGFGYLGIGIIATNMIILTFKIINKYNCKKLYLLLLLFNFGLFNSYYLFAPIVFLSEFIYLLYLFRNKKCDLKQIIKIIIIYILMPTIFGYFFYIKYSKISIIDTYNIVGKSYQDLIGNYILLIPLLFNSIYLQAKSNKSDFDLILLICLFVYVIITFLLIGTGLISSYYFYKPYYILWLIVNLSIYKLINYKEYTKLLIMQYLFIIIVLFFSFFDIEKKINSVNQDFNYSGIFNKLSDIYVFNKNKILKPSIHITPDRMKLMKNSVKYYDECESRDNKNELPYISSHYNKIWYQLINEYTSDVDYIEYLAYYGADNNNAEIDFGLAKNFGINDNTIDDNNYSAFLEYDNLKCILVDNDAIGNLKKHNFGDDYDILYENKSGKLYKKKT